MMGGEQRSRDFENSLSSPPKRKNSVNLMKMKLEDSCRTPVAIEKSVINQEPPEDESNSSRQ